MEKRSHQVSSEEEPLGKRPLITSAPTSFLEVRALLRHVLMFVGRGKWRFIAGVNKEWRDVYKLIENDTCTSFSHGDTCTSFRNALSTSRLRLAVAEGVLKQEVTPETNHLYAYQGNFFHAVGRYADIETIVWLKEQGVEWTSDICEGAAYANRVDLLKWLHEEGCPWDTNRMAGAAAFSGSLPVLKYLRGQPDGRWDNHIVISKAAVESFRTPTSPTSVVEWMHGEGILHEGEDDPLTRHARNIPLLSWLFSHGFELNILAVFDAISRDDVERLQWLYEHIDEEEWSWSVRSTVEVAIGDSGGVSAVLLWLRGLDDGQIREELFSPRTLLYGGLHSYKTVAEWLVENGASWPVHLWPEGDEFEIDCPVQYFCCWEKELMEWALEKGCPLSALDGFCTAVEGKSLATYNKDGEIQDDAHLAMSKEDFDEVHVWLHEIDACSCAHYVVL